MRLLLVVFVFALSVLPGRPLAAQSSSVAPNAPPDRPLTAVMVCQWEATRKAYAPYSAHARATYAAARARFLDRSKPIRPMFVTTILTDSTNRHEQVFIAVDSIVATRIYGTVASEIGVVAGFHRGQRYSLEEADLIDWMFANPDGSEEGNFVGKFMDTYTPPKSCGSV